jgi:hypothetical protein
MVCQDMISCANRLSSWSKKRGCSNRSGGSDGSRSRSGKVKEIKQVKVFFMSAFQIDDIQFRTELPFVGINEFIQKPVSKYIIVNQQMLKYQGS